MKLPMHPEFCLSASSRKFSNTLQSTLLNFSGTSMRCRLEPSHFLLHVF